MLYENTVLKTFNDSHTKLLIRQESFRKEIATMIYAFYTNNKPLINYYVKQYMLNSGVSDLKIWDSKAKTRTTVPDESNQVGMFTEKTIDIMPKIHIDLVGKVLDLVCTIYNAGADRYLTNANGDIDEGETEKFMDAYNKINFPKIINSIYKQGYLFNTILAQPVFRNERVEIDIITPNFCSVVGRDEDFTRADKVMISKAIGDEDLIVYWSDEEHCYINPTTWKKIPIEGNPGMVNPYGQLPFAKLSFNESSDYWGEPQQDLVENNIWYDVKEMNSFFVEMFQGLGVGVGINLSKNGTISLSPNTMILVDKVTSDMVPPSINFSSTGAPLSELRESSNEFYKRIGNSKGLSSQSMSNEISDQSGISKAYDSAELSIKKDSHKIIMKAFEKDLFGKFRMVYNFHMKDKISDKLMFKIDITEDEPQINVSEEIAITEFRINNNLTSIVDLMIKDNPDLNTEEAMTRLEQNKILNEKYLTNHNLIENGKAKESNSEDGNSTEGDNSGDSESDNSSDK